MAAELYDPNKVTLTLGTHLARGFMEGTMIGVTWLSDGNVLSMGALGVGALVTTNNLSAEITVTFQQTSSSNERYTAIFNGNREGLVVPCVMRDAGGGGRTLLTAATAWIKKMPDTGMSSNTTEGRAWTITTDRLLGVVGGNDKAALQSG